MPWLRECVQAHWLTMKISWEPVSTTTKWHLGFLERGGINKEGHDEGQLFKSDIDVKDYFNLLLSPALPQRYLEQLGEKCDSDLGDKNNNNNNNNSINKSPYRYYLRQQYSTQLRRGYRSPARRAGRRPR